MLPLLCSLAITAGQTPPPMPPDPRPVGPKGPDVTEVTPAKPAEVKAFTTVAGSYIKLKADADKAYWDVPPGTAGVYLVADGSTCTFGSLTPGKYCVSCSAGGPVTWLEITVKAVVPPPGPVPPGPVPPGPTPPPVPPVPADPLVDAIRLVMDKTVDKNQRVESAKDLAALLRQFVKIVGRDGVGTVGQLASALADSMNDFVQADGRPLGLPSVRRLLVAELVKVTGKDNIALTADAKKGVSDFFERFAKSVEAVAAE